MTIATFLKETYTYTFSQALLHCLGIIVGDKSIVQWTAHAGQYFAISLGENAQLNNIAET